MPLLEIFAWLMIAGGLLVLAGCVGLAFRIRETPSKGGAS